MICATEPPGKLTEIFTQKLQSISYFPQYVRNTFQCGKYLTSYGGDERKTHVNIHI